MEETGMGTQKLRALDPLLHHEIEDLLHKESNFIERFYQLVDDMVEPPFAISVDGLWGTGKTTVMQLLQAKLRDRNYPVFWFNPWKYSQNSDVVLAFLQALVKDKDYQPAFEQIKASSGKIFQVVMDIGLNTALKFVTQGAVSLGDVKKQFEKVELPFETYQDMIVKLEVAFRDLVNAISKANQNKPLIIFLDDFDRCLPQDAIKLLEALKNLFVTKDCRVIFICGIDTRVAKSFIRDHYKVTDEFAINYFRKIFNLTVSMPYHQNATIHALLSDYVAEVYGWDEAMADALAKRVTLWGARAEMASVRKYLNVIHTFYAFLMFNDSYRFNPEQDDMIVHLLVIKEAWQPLYEELVKEAIKNRTASLSEVVNTIIQDDNARKTRTLKPEQQAFLQDFSASPDYPFHREKLGNDYLLRYPTLA
jgi:hypothetical protein